jgi:molecular chaperone GrpE (heat shock protein)
MLTIVTEDEGEDMPMYQSNIDILNELNSLRAENKRLKAQLKELREELAKYKAKEDAQEKAIENAINSMNSIVDNLEEKIDEVCARTLCSRKEALDILSQNNYNVDITIAQINWSKLNVPSEIL